jgi:hypothetical protein
MGLTICDVQRVAAKRFPFDDSHYPDMPAGEKGQFFAQKHLHLHLVKNIGEIAAALEPMDHGRENGSRVSPQVIRKLLVNTLRLADMSGITIESVGASLDNWSKGLER